MLKPFTYLTCLKFKNNLDTFLKMYLFFFKAEKESYKYEFDSYGAFTLLSAHIKKLIKHFTSQTQHCKFSNRNSDIKGKHPTNVNKKVN